jgi:hypothetical protein
MLMKAAYVGPLKYFFFHRRLKLKTYTKCCKAIKAEAVENVTGLFRGFQLKPIKPNVNDENFCAADVHQMFEFLLPEWKFYGTIFSVDTAEI